MIKGKIEDKVRIRLVVSSGCRKTNPNSINAKREKQILSELRKTGIRNIHVLDMFDHDQHMILNERLQGVYFERRAKCTTISPCKIRHHEDGIKLKSMFNRKWKNTIPVKP
jgi:RIO-like serine/threonine protein kinase